ncbi:hypothetical protein HNR03_000191 [Pseudomonas sp. JAI111]|nr:hypothetical protein [Pseudomonas sp. JAI111]
MLQDSQVRGQSLLNNLTEGADIQLYGCDLRAAARQLVR